MKNYSEEKKWLSSEDIFLAPLEEFHIKYLIKLTENQNLIKSMGWDARFDPHETEQFIRSVSSCALPYCCKKSQPVVFGIFLKTNNMPIGYSVLKGMNTDIAVAEIGIAIIKTECRGSGYGRLALKSTVEYGFQKINLRTIGATILLSNTVSINMCKRVGFREKEVLPRSWTMPDGEVVDMVWMEITRENFAAK
jgi:RimJ/RimL family protein N-acetyltransferase